MPIKMGFIGLAVALGLACSDDVPGKKNGEPCVGHQECASGLCTAPPTDGGTKKADGGTESKRCTEPGLVP